MDKIYGLRYDASFKKVYQKKEHLTKLMKDLFHQDLQHIKYSNKELSKENKNLRYRVTDLVIETKHKIMIIELQNKDLENIEPRVTMYTFGFYSRQDPGQDYEKVKPVEVYLILNYPYGKKQVLKEYQQLEKNLDEKFGNLSKIKIWNIQEALKNVGTIDYDYARLFQLDQYSVPEAKKILNEIRKKKQFGTLVHEIDLYNMDLEMFLKLKEEEFMEMTFEQATSAIRSHAKELGMTIGKKEGEKIGEKRGKKRGKLKTAHNLLLEGVPIELIMKVTNLSKNEIEHFNKVNA